MSKVGTNSALVLAGAACWVAVGAAGWGAWGFFLPLVFFALLVPALLAAFSVGSWPVRALVLLAPSTVAAATLFASPEAVEGWSVLVAQITLGGATIVLVGFLTQTAWRAFGPTSRLTRRTTASLPPAG
jgi:hypothetical protein